MDAWQRNSVAAYLQFVAAEIIGPDADRILHHRAPSERRLDLNPDRSADARFTFHGEQRGFQPDAHFRRAGALLVHDLQFHLSGERRVLRHLEIDLLRGHVEQAGGESGERHLHAAKLRGINQAFGEVLHRARRIGSFGAARVGVGGARRVGAEMLAVDGNQHSRCERDLLAGAGRQYAIGAE